MIFHSLEFIFLFLPIVLLFYFKLKNHSLRLFLLVISSYFFYGFWNPKFMGLLFFSTSVDFLLGIWISETQDLTKRRSLLYLSIILNLGVLGYFKYGNFFLDHYYTLMKGVNPHFSIPPHNPILLPVGISFYTFLSLSYTIDVYWNRCQPHRHFLAYAGFVSFFPHLVAGPLIRHQQLVCQLEDVHRGRFQAVNVAYGLCFFVLGLGKKTLIADRLGDGINPLLDLLNLLTPLEAWICLLGYAFELYFDFSGYSDMATGLARMMNIDFPKNFYSPYQADSMADFWKRWHISLSSWLRDYLYIPLGGNQKGRWKTYRNLFLTLLLGGFWHGAHWVFIIWGAYHGLWLVMERAFFPSTFKSTFLKPWRIFRTFFIVLIGWVFFRSPDLHFAGSWLAKLFSIQSFFVLSHFEPKFRDRFFVAGILALLITFGMKNTWELNLEAWMNRKGAVAIASLMVGCLLFFSKNSPFLYFQF